MIVKEFLGRLEGVRRSSGGWMARCPAHEDRNPSLSVHEVNGTILLKCFAGCAFDEIVAALGLEKQDFFAGSGNARERPLAAFDYTDEGGKLLYQVVRFEPKTFRQRRPDGAGAWIWNLHGVRRVPYRLPEVMAAKSVLIPEGEKDCQTAGALGVVATCNSNGAGKWPAQFAPYFAGKRVAIIADADPPGLAHARDVARALVGVAESVRLIEALPGGGKDLTDFVERGGTRERLLEIVKGTPELTPAELLNWKPRVEENSSPWARAETMRVFLAGTEDSVTFLDPDKRILARESITEIFSPRGLGKTLFSLWLAIQCARKGLRVLLIDRDNPRSVVKKRLRSFGADPEMSTLKAITREKCPPLTDSAAWATFPYADYDVVILDSLDSAAEGVGEQDSAKPSRAFAPLLDIARRENGPAVLVLGNCVKTAAHSRGSGIIEDRSDIVFEVRDATDFHPSGKKPWPEELPPADAGSWAARSSRRKQRQTYRLAFIATKFRIAEEPEPFILEIDISAEPWTVRDVTDAVDQEGAAERERRAKERVEQLAKATEALATEIVRRLETGEPEILKKEAETFLTALGFTQKLAREALISPTFETVALPGQGHPKALRLGSIKTPGNRNTEPSEAARIAVGNDADFGCPIFMHPTEIGPAQGQSLCTSERADISVDQPVYTPPPSLEKETENAAEPVAATPKPKEVQWEV